MTPAPSDEYLERFSAALVLEIKAEMGRRDLSARGLATLIGVNPQYVTSRIAGGNPRTGKRVEITVPDLKRIAGALDLDPIDLMTRARDAASSGDDLAARRASRVSDPAPIVTDADLAKLPAAAEPKRRDDGTRE
jgi:transcriptional regulator with XRE-family HTH domain